MIITTLTCMCVDIFDNTIMPGGESLNFAATISRLTDAKVCIIGAVGNDSYGKTVLDSIKDFNIDKTHIRTENGDTASNRTYLTPDGDRYYKDDSWNGGVFIVTLGENGSTAFSKGTAYHCAAAEVSEVTDTTGCGDSYQAGFIASYLADGNIETAMSKGSQTAAQTLSFIGGFRY